MEMVMMQLGWLRPRKLEKEWKTDAYSEEKEEAAEIFPKHGKTQFTQASGEKRRIS